MLNGIFKFIAEVITPDANVGWRWKLKNIILRRLGLNVGEKVAIDKGFDWLIKSGQITLEDHAVVGHSCVAGELPQPCDVAVLEKLAGRVQHHQQATVRGGGGGGVEGQRRKQSETAV